MKESSRWKVGLAAFNDAPLLISVITKLVVREREGRGGHRESVCVARARARATGGSGRGLRWRTIHRERKGRTAGWVHLSFMHRLG